MKKVYFGERYLLLANPDEISTTSSFCSTHKLSSKESLQSYINEFMSNNDTNGLILSSDVNSLWNTFCQLFKNIDAAGGLIENSFHEVLVIDRRGYIDLPKGKKEADETDEANALREVEEETGIQNVRISSHLINTYHTYPLNGELVLKCTHWYKMEVAGRPALTPQTEEDIIQAQWVNKESIHSLASKTYASLKDVFLNA